MKKTSPVGGDHAGVGKTVAVGSGDNFVRKMVTEIWGGFGADLASWYGVEGRVIYYWAWFSIPPVRLKAVRILYCLKNIDRAVYYKILLGVPRILGRPYDDWRNALLGWKAVAMYPVCDVITQIWGTDEACARWFGITEVAVKKWVNRGLWPAGRQEVVLILLLLNMYSPDLYKLIFSVFSAEFAEEVQDEARK